MLKLFKKIYNLYFSENKEQAKKIKSLIGFTPVNMSIFILAFKHSSKVNDDHASNERLEFLGDSVLGAVIAEYLFKKYPLRGEGFLTEMRSKIVNRKSLGTIGEQLQLQDYLEYDKGYVSINATLLGNTLEALVGAVYLDAGFIKTKNFIMQKIVNLHIDLDDLELNDINYKSRLLEWAQKYSKQLMFNILEERVQKNGIKTFIIAVLIDGKQIGVGKGKSKKDAEKEAAQQAYNKLNVAAEAAN